jgi:hypothetical protein
MFASEKSPLDRLLSTPASSFTIDLVLTTKVKNLRSCLQVLMSTVAFSAFWGILKPGSSNVFKYVESLRSVAL